MSGFNPKNPPKYQGTDQYLTPNITRNRRPTGADYRQPETGRNYPLTSIWQVGKDPTTGSEGELWLLAKIVANVATWIMLGSGSTPPILSVNVDAATPPGTDPTLATAAGELTLTAAQIANASLANVMQTNSLAANSITIQIQQSALAAATDSTKNGVAHFNSTHFTAGANAFISSQIATTSQIGIVTLASQVQSEFNTYGTTQVLQSGNISFMMAKPAPIGSTSPNTGAFTSLSSNAAQTFSAGTDVFPVTSVTALTTATVAPNVTIRTYMGSTTPGSIGADFGNAIELFCMDTAAQQELCGSMIAQWTTATSGAETSRILFRVRSAAANTDVITFFPDRIQLSAATSRYRIGASGVDFMSGSGDPNGVVTAAQGSLYMRTDGSSGSTRAYVNTDSSTAWTSVTTAT